MESDTKYCKYFFSTWLEENWFSPTGMLIHNVNHGVPQGTIVATKLFLTTVNDVNQPGSLLLFAIQLIRQRVKHLRKLK